MEIRKAWLRDLKEIQRLNFELCKREFSKFDTTINVRFPLERAGHAYFKERISGKNSLSLIATDKNKTIGYLVGSIGKSESYRNIKKIAEVENMFIVEKYRHKGIGSILIKEFLKWCKINKANRVKSIISHNNLNSIKFHKQNGFKDYNIVLEKDI